jgi:hypothetical protein
VTINDRIYTREEFARILERAEVLERRADVALGSEPGFSLTQMRKIAAEAGIDPDAVERAAHLLPPTAPGRPTEHTTGGLLRQRIQASFPVALTAEGSAKLLAVIRASSGHPGSGEVTVTGLSWWANQGDMHVEVHANRDSTLVEVSVDRSRKLILPVLLGTVTTWIVASLLEVASLGVILASVALGLGVAGVIFRRLIKNGKKRTEALMSSIARAMERLAESGAPVPSVDRIQSRSDRDASPPADDSRST